MPSAPRRFWFWYTLVWLPPLAIYFFGFRLQGRLDLSSIALASLASVLPEALLGIGLVHGCRRAWRGDTRRAVGTNLLLLALVYTVLATALKATLSLQLSRREGSGWDWSTYDRSLLLWQAFFCLITFAVITSVTFGLASSARLREEEERRSRAELLRARSELKALRAQLNPHFLFNTLHSLRALVGEQPAAAEEALEQLGDLLRYSLRIQDAAHEEVLLREEWEFVRAYLALERLRLGARLQVEAEVSPRTLDCVVPAFVLQPLVENAIRHAIAPRAGGGCLRIRSSVAQGLLRLDVSDDGPGGQATGTRGTGKGLELLRQRLRALHGERGSLEIATAPGAGFAVTVVLPCRGELA